MADKKEETTNIAVTTDEKETSVNIAAASDENDKAESAKSAVPAPKKQKAAKAAVKDDGLVEFYAFKDNDKYKDDIFVAINGKALKIKRGVKVRIPKAYAEVLRQSQEQDTATADLIERESEAYAVASQVIG